MAARLTSAILIASMLGLSVAQAASNVAEISLVQGKVLVNQGAGFVALAEGASLKAGDKVLVGKDSSALIAYNSGCAVSIHEAKIVTVSKVAPCKAGEVVASVGSDLVSPVAVHVAAPAFLAGNLGPVVVLGGAGLLVAGYLVFKKSASN